MARKFLTSIDLTQLELLNPRAQNLATPPASPVAGQFYFDTGLGVLRFWDGAAWVDARGVEGGAEPIGAAGGDLSGSYPDPQIAPGAIVDADVNAAAGIALSKLAVDPLARANHTGTQSADSLVDGTANHVFSAADDAKLAGVAEGATANSADAELRDRATHTGTQAAGTIVDFDTAVRASRLDQMAAPTAALDANGQRVTNLAAPTAEGDAANKAYVDGLAAGLSWKDSARVHAAAGADLLGPGATLDGVALAPGDRVLVTGQPDPAQNGLWVFNGASSAMTRPPDADSSADIAGMAVFVTEGTSADTGWVLTTDAPVLGTDALTFTQFTGTGDLVAGAGLTRDGNTIDVVGGAGITVAADSVAIDPAVVARRYAADVDAGTAVVLTHNLGTRDVAVQVYLNSGTFEGVECDVERTSVNTVTLRFATAVTAGQYRAVVTG